MRIDVALALACCAVSITSVFGQSDAARLERLEEAVQKLQQENASLKKEVESLRGSPITTNAPAAIEHSPFVFTRGKAATVRLGGVIQVNGEFGDADSVFGNFSDNPLTPSRAVTHDRIRLRRARINVSGDFIADLDYKLEGDFALGDGLNGGRVGFSGTDIFANWHRFPEAQFRVGQFKSPFGQEHLTSDTSLYTAERSLVTTALTQDRQIGIAIWGKPLTQAGKGFSEMVDYYVGVFNGNGRNTTINDDDHFMYAGRLGFTPWKGEMLEEPVTLHFGINAYAARFATGSRVSPAGNLMMNLVDGSLAPFLSPADSRAIGWGMDEWLTIGPFDLSAEYLEGHYEPRGNKAFTSFTPNGYYIQTSYFLPFMGGKKFQLAARWESFNPDQAPHDDISSFTVGVNYYISGEALKVQLNYVRTWSDFRQNHSLAGDRDFDMILARFHLMF